MLGLSTYLELSIFIDLIASICFTMILMLIKIPHSDYSRNLSWSKGFITACFAAFAIVFWFMLSHRNLPDFPLFATMMMMVITAVSAATLSYSLVSLLDEKATSRDAFLVNVLVVTILGTAMARVMIHGHRTATIVLMVIFIIVHVSQCVAHIIKFNAVFKRSVRQLEEYYDEENYHRIKWIRFCFIIMMATDMFILAYMTFFFIFQKDAIMVAYILFYALFMVYFTSNYISFLGSHKLLLDAFAHEMLEKGVGPKYGPGNPRPARQKKNKKDGGVVQDAGNGSQEAASAVQTTGSELENDYREREFRRIAKALERWVNEKHYREYDKSREEIAEELRTSREMLQLYFAVRVGEDFRTWRTELRIEDAKKMLLEDKRASVNMIAEISGFSDRSNFHRQFTKFVGCSPKEWRECDGHPENLRQTGLRI